MFAAWAVYGALEEILTGWVLGQLPAEEEDVERAVSDGGRRDVGRIGGMIVNLRDCELESLDDGPAGRKFRARSLGATVGAKVTGCGVYELEPGNASWPYHFELSEEEWLFVIDGEVNVRTPDGEHLLRSGDVVCFPVGAAGAHAVSQPREWHCTLRDDLSRIHQGRRSGVSRRAESSSSTRTGSSIVAGSANRSTTGRACELSSTSNCRRTKTTLAGYHTSYVRIGTGSRR